MIILLCSLSDVSHVSCIVLSVVVLETTSEFSLRCLVQSHKVPLKFMGNLFLS